MPKHNRPTAHLATALRLCLQIALALLACGAVPRLAAAAGVLHHFAFDYITSPKFTDTYFFIRITARDDAGNLVTNFNGTGTLSATNGGVTVPIGGITSAAFSNGVWEPFVSTNTRCNALVLHCANAAGTVTGEANAIRIDPPAVQTVSITSTDLAYSPTTGLLYASTTSGTLVPINPETVTAGMPVSVAGTPITTLLASDDGTQLFATHADNQRLLRIPTSTLVPAANFPLGTNGEVIRSLATVPGQPLAIAVATTKGVVDGPFELAVFDGGTRRSKVITTTDREVSLLNNGISGRLLALGQGQDHEQLYRASIDATGFSLLDQKVISFNPSNAVAGGDRLTNGFGTVIDTISGNLLATLDKTGGYGLVCFDTVANRIFLLERYDYWSFTLRSFNAATFEQVAHFDVQDVHGTPTRLLRWGQRGLAFRTENKVFILSGDFVPNSTSADLKLDVVDSPNPAVAGQTLTYTVRVSNNGKIPSEDVVLTDQLPAGATFQNASTEQGSISHTGATVTANLGTIPAGANVLVHIRVVPPSAGSLTNIARVLAATADPSTLNNQVETGSYAQPDFNGLLHRDWIGATGIATDGNRLFVTLSNTSPARPNSVATIDPATLALLRADLVSGRPNQIALTEDRTHAHIGLGGICAMRSLDLTSGSAGAIVSFPVTDNGVFQYACAFAPLAGSNTAVAVMLRNTNWDSDDELAIYDGATKRPLSILEKERGIRLSREIATNELHAVLNAWIPGFASYTITDNGPVLLKQTVDLIPTVNGGSVNQVAPLGRFAVTSQGTVIDPGTHTIVAQMNADGVVATDDDNHRVYFLSTSFNHPNTSGPGTITAFDTDSWQTTSTVPVGDINEPIGLVRWGEYGLAFVTTSGALYSITSQQLVPHPPLRVKLPAATTEGAGTLAAAGRVELLRPAPTALTVTLTSSAPGVLSVPPSVMIPQGATSVAFDLTVPNNNYLNGPRTVTISPAATGPFTFRPATITVSDDEAATLSLSLPASVTEGGPPLSGVGRVTLSDVAGVDIPVRLTSSSPTKVAIPLVVVVPAGANCVTFDLTSPNNDVLDGTQAVTITAAISGWASSAISLLVYDNDENQLTLDLPATMAEGAYTNSASVRLSAKTLVPVEIQLSLDTPKAYVPSTLVIPAGETSVPFAIRSFSDFEANPDSTLSITASAAGFRATTKKVEIIDDDPAYVEWSNIEDPKQAGEFFTAKLLLKTLQGALATDCSGSIRFRATNANGSAVVIPSNVDLAGNSEVTLRFSVQTSGHSTRLYADTSNGAQGQSGLFAVTPAPANALHWDAVPEIVETGVPFAAAIHAIDRFGNATTDFSGQVSIAGIYAARSISEIKGTDSIPLFRLPSPVVSRTTAVIPRSALGAAPGMLRALAFDVTNPPSRPLENLTIRIKTTKRSWYVWADRSWDPDGWTTVYQGPAPLESVGWTTFRLSDTFIYDGVSNLLIDFSFNNSATEHPAELWVRGDGYGGTHIETSEYEAPFSNPLLWGTANADAALTEIPNLRFSFGMSLTSGSIFPSDVQVLDGVWTGQITVYSSRSPALLTAKATTGNYGESSIFTVFARKETIPRPTITPEPPWTGGTSNIIAWKSLPDLGHFEVQCAEDANFTVPRSSGAIADTQWSFDNLVEGKEYFYRARAVTWVDGIPYVGPWSSTASSVQDNTGPSIAVTSPLLTTESSFALSGTAHDAISGVRSISTGNTEAIIANNSDQWSLQIPLSSGANTFTLRATDNASPEQVTERNVTIFRLPSLGDSDGDGFSDLLEYALGLNPLAANSAGGPTTALQTSPGDGLSYLTFTYRRRVLRDGLTYHVETAPDLSTWTEVTNPVEIAATPNGDGLTETVTVRLQPAISAATPRRFVRLKVTTP